MILEFEVYNNWKDSKMKPPASFCGKMGCAFKRTVRTHGKVHFTIKQNHHKALSLTVYRYPRSNAERYELGRGQI